ncbi:MAG: ATP-binding protein [Terrisporobacter othiniensis]|nr:ATP-binding protein [Terrisporobacter othiniensis]MDU6995222.1 ATP-binding protein [Terrisporobacter othiniensis]
MDNMKRYKYKLETHLKILCENNPEYKNLCSSWELNKTTYKNILGTIQLNYPHYSLHDSTHSESIITNIEMLLGEDRIKKLSPTDTWLLLNCSYLHDFGMALIYSNIEKEWENANFKCYLNKLKKSSDCNLKEAVNYIDNLKENLNDDDFEAIWPLKIRRFVTQIIADYYRGKHSNLSKEYLNKLDEWNLDLTQNGLINTRLIILIGEISSLHTQDFEDVMKLDYISNGYNADYIHPRFIAEMIRLGDLLDLDNGRFNEYVEKVVGELPEISKVHKAKHKATTHILVNPIMIELRADCPDDNVYREVRNWVSWLEEEIKYISLNIKDIFPSNLEAYIAKLKKVDLLINGDRNLNEKADLEFKISQKKAFEIIEGSNIYENKITFIREFVQNALDASKLQLWKDLNNGIYDPWLKDIMGDDIKYEDLTPFDLLKCKIFNNYEISIYIENTNSNIVKVLIEDKGTGISIDNLKAMCDVGESYNDRHTIYDDSYKMYSMPTWLRPTGGFGIGMQSGFLVTDKFTAYTKYNSSPVMEIQFEPATTGYISIRQSKVNIKRGTKIEIFVNEMDSFKFSFGGNLDNFITNDYDVFKKSNLTFYNVLDYASSSVNSTFFPINIYIDNKKEKVIQNSEKMNFKFEPYESKFLYHLEEDLSKMIVWDKKYSIYFEIRINEFSLEQSSVEAYFKGCRINEAVKCNYDGFDIVLDIYGFDTKETLQLSRDKLTQEGKNKLNKIFLRIIEFYLKRLKEKIDHTKNHGNLDIFKFIILSSKYLGDFKLDKYKYLLESIDHNITVYKKENEKYRLIEIQFKDIYDNFPHNINYINIEGFKKKEKGAEVVNYSEIESILNNNVNDLKYEIIIVEEAFIKVIRNLLINEIKYINGNRPFFIYSIKNEDRCSVRVDENTRKYIISKLAITDSNKQHYRYGQSLKRCYIPAIEDYSILAVKEIYNIISGDFYNTDKIISPITRDDALSINDFINSELFIKSIEVREDYINLLNFTYSNQIGESSIEEIDEKYKELIREYYKLCKNINQ